MSVVLRDYQTEAIEAVWAEIKLGPTALIAASTGLGKTEVLIGLIEKSHNCYPLFKCVFLVNKLNLLGQTARRLRHHLGTDAVGEYHGKQKELTAMVTVASIQSIHKMPINCNMLILDECHNVDQEEGRYITFINRCIETNPRLKVVATTATPFRSDGYIYGPDKMYKKITFERGLLWAQENGHLCRVKMKHQGSHKFDTSKLKIRMGEYDQKELAVLTADEEKVKEQLLNALPQLEGRNKAVWACSNIAHCELVHQKLLAMGEDAVVLHSKLEDEEADNSILSFEKGSARHLIFVTIVSEGYDYPPIDAVIIMRPTRSPVLYVQTIGRGLRPSPATGKADCMVLDYGGVIENMGPLHAPHIRTGGKQSKDVKEIKMKFCPNCLEYCEIKATNCPICHHDFMKAIKELNLKNLTTRSYHGSIDGTSKHKILFAKVLKHKSKAGNDGAKIEYHLEGMFPRLVIEFFLPDQAWSFSKMEKRLAVFGINHFNEQTYNSTMLCKDKNIIAKLAKNDKGYYEVQSVTSFKTETIE